jgi:hypothetical protein
MAIKEASTLGEEIGFNFRTGVNIAMRKTLFAAIIVVNNSTMKNCIA